MSGPEVRFVEEDELPSGHDRAGACRVRPTSRLYGGRAEMGQRDGQVGAEPPCGLRER
jgi:hypothetical protein